MASKTEIRNQYIGIINTISESSHRRWSKIICVKLKDWLKKHQPKSIAAFYPVRNEPSIWSILTEFAKHGDLYLPKYDGEKNRYQWSLYSGDLILSEFSIMEPKVWRLPNAKLGVCFVPAVCVDKQGNRLGWGHGYFDRLISEVDHRVGVLFANQITDGIIPNDIWDVQLTERITNN